MSSRSWGSRRPVLLAALLVAAAVFVLIGTSTPAFATQEISFRIDTFGEADCTSGSNVFVFSFADPFDVDVCATDGGIASAGLALTAVVSHSDGSTQEILITTDAGGKVTFLVTPVGPGATSVEVCLEGDCDHGSVEFRADGPARPPAVASYLGPTNDLGVSGSIKDEGDDFTDADTGGAAEVGSGDPAIDILSFRYLGVEGGVARFEIITRGDARKLLTEKVPFVQWTIRVTTPDGGMYSLSYRSENGISSVYASSGDAELDGVVVVVAAGKGNSTVILSATGVDVPEGSTMVAETWLSRKEDSSGYRDAVEGRATPPGTVNEKDETPAVIVDQPDEAETSPPATISGEDDGGSFPIGVALGVIGALTGAYVWWKRSSEPITLGPQLPEIIKDPRPGKGVGGGPDSPPLIGVPGWKI